MMSSCSVSVVIPAYNRANLLPRAIDSVLAQTRQNFELIIVDDGSMDNTKEIVQNYSYPKIRYIRNESNLGATRSRNIGIQNSMGDVIAFLDSDDTWLPNKLEDQLKYIPEVHRHEPWVCFTPVRVKGTSQEYTIPERGLLPDEHLSEYLFFNGGIILTSTILVSRAAALRLPFTPDLKLHQDADFCLRHYLQNTQFFFCPKPLTFWYNDYRSDRICPHHKPIDRLQWMLLNIELFTEKACESFLKSHILPLFTTLQERTEAQQFVGRLLVQKKLHPHVALDAIRCLQ